VEVETRHIWNRPPTRQELAEMAALHPEGAAGLLSRRSTRFRELGLGERPLRPEELLDLLAREPRLLRRPLITDGRRLVVGFDQQALQALLGT
jgi:Spx/MgsR family transcriptional regulator